MCIKSSLTFIPPFISEAVPCCIMVASIANSMDQDETAPIFHLDPYCLHAT